MSEINKLRSGFEATGNHLIFIKDVSGYIVKYATCIENKINPNRLSRQKPVELVGG